MEPSRTRLLVLAGLVLSAVALAAAPLVLPDAYSLVGHTLSEAAGQGTKGAWLGRTGFLLFGLAILALSVVRREWPGSGRWLHRLFGVLMIASAVYSHRPFLAGVSADGVEDAIHSFAATAIGFVFAAGVAVVGWRRVPRWRFTDIVAVLAPVLIPLVMSWYPQWVGVLQRGMFLVVYVWYGVEAAASSRRSVFTPVL